MKSIRKIGLVLAAVALSAGVSTMIEGPAHADTSWGQAFVNSSR